MLWAPFQQTTIYGNHSIGGTPIADGGAALVTSGTANNKGAWTVLLNGATQESKGVWFGFTNSQVSGGGDVDSIIMDIGLGATSSESVVISNLLVSRLRLAADGIAPMAVFIPLRIQKGQVLSARTQSGTASQTSRVLTATYQGKPGGGDFYTGADGYGISLAASVGLGHTCGASGSFSSWVEFPDASTQTTRDYKGIMLVIDGEAATTSANAAYHIQLSTDASTTIGTWYCSITSVEDRFYWPGLVVPCAIPAGTQIWMRGTCSGAAEVMSCAYYGFY